MFCRPFWFIKATDEYGDWFYCPGRFASRWSDSYADADHFGSEAAALRVAAGCRASFNKYRDPANVKVRVVPVKPIGG